MRRSRHPALGTVRSLRRGQVGAEPLRFHLVLAGGGHTHALLLRRWLMRPRLRPAHTLVTLVSRQSTAPYSGMLPALVAGLIAPQECAIDLRRLCALAGVSFLRAEIVGLDPLARELRLQGRPPLRFDRLSLDVGAVTAGAGAASGQAVKPLEPFLAWLSSLMPASELRIRGGGAAAVELALALRARGHGPRLLLRGQGLRLGSAAANRLGERLLAEAAIPLERNVPPEAPADLACTGSRAPAWLAAAGLPVEPATGRVLTAASLLVLEHPHLFAAGDCAVVAEAPRPASGVWAVRAAPVLATNLQRSLEQPQRPLRPWRPQRRALQLLGDGGWSPQGPRAVAFWGPFALGPSRWLWRWKHQLDRGFLEGFTALAPMQPEAMACRGCAAKLAAAPLEGALARLEGMAMAQAPSPTAPDRAATAPPAAPPPEDAAVLATAADGSLLLQSVDGFPALVADPWLNARLTTLHACGDLWASGAAVDSVQALVTLPEATPALQEELLLQTLAGVRSVLDPLGARLIGGHTLEGRDGAGLALALTVNGRAAPGRHWPKGPLHPGDDLLLCGPLGSGVLFAAAMAGAARPEWIDAALERMQRSQAPLVELLAAYGCRACTDITGFGLLGHLGEMLGAGGPGLGSGVLERQGFQDVDAGHEGGTEAACAWSAVAGAAGAGAADAGPVCTGRSAGAGAAGDGGAMRPLAVTLDTAAIGALPGALELLEQGWASTLAPANGRALALLQGPIHLVTAGRPTALKALLIDPQTCGPLLAALPAERAGSALAAVHRAGFAEAALIGRVQEGPWPLPIRPA
jgi:selenide,water dikinase